MVKELIYLIIILFGIPVGLFLAKTCKEEIKAWNKRLKILIICCFLIGIFLFFVDFQYKIPIIITLSWMTITFLIIIFRIR